VAAFERIRNEVAQLTTIYNDSRDEEVGIIDLLDLAAALSDGISIESRILDCAHGTARPGTDPDLPVLESAETRWRHDWHSAVARIVGHSDEPSLSVR
jgi:hypothetical protein